MKEKYNNSKLKQRKFPLADSANMDGAQFVYADLDRVTIGPDMIDSHRALNYYRYPIQLYSDLQIYLPRTIYISMLCLPRTIYLSMLYLPRNIHIDAIRAKDNIHIDAIIPAGLWRAYSRDADQCENSLSGRGLTRGSCARVVIATSPGPLPRPGITHVDVKKW